MRELLAAVADLVLPLTCAGCGTPGVRLCGSCALALAGPPVRCEQDAPGLNTGTWTLPVWRVGVYAGTTRDLVLAWKNHGRGDVTGDLAAILEQAAWAIASQGGELWGDLPLAVIPAPSRRAADRARGGNLVGELAAGVVRGLRTAGVPARQASVLVRSGRDQVGLGQRQRARIAISAKRQVARPVLLVDDVLTTGATLAACHRALPTAVGAIVLAATPKRVVTAR